MPKLRSGRVPPPGVFLSTDAAKRGARDAGVDVLDLSVGSSDLPPPPEALTAIKAAIDNEPDAVHKYLLRSRTMPLLRAACSWFKEAYNVELDPATEALALIGSQEGLAHLLLAVCDPGDAILMPEVCYPSYFGACDVAGVEPVFVPLDRAGDAPTWLPKLDAIADADAKRCSALLLNLPSNPTGAVADEAWWREALAFCERHDLMLIHDAPYVGMQFDRSCAASPLALPGGRHRVIELHSLSKSWQMGGWRCGWALGCAEAIESLERVKAPIDFNSPLAILRAGEACLQLPWRVVEDYAKIWRARAEALVEVLKRRGWRGVQPPRACMYVWAPLPGLCVDDVEFCSRLVREAGVALSPGRCFGPGGVGCVRFALVAPAEELVRAGERVCDFAEQLIAEGAAGAGGGGKEGAVAAAAAQKVAAAGGGVAEANGVVI